jgi:hypothetical protein
MRRRRLLASAWLGLSLAGLFLYPLASALDADSYYLQWQQQHTGEAALAFALLTVVLGLAIHLVWPRPGRAANLALLAVVLLPLLSFGAGAARQVPFGADLRAAWELRSVRIGVPAAAAMFAGGAFLAFPRRFGRGLRALVAVLSPVWLVVAWGLFSPPWPRATVTAIEAARESTAHRTGCAPVLALLFDELSYSYLYADGDVADSFPAIRRLGNHASHYHAASSPGATTLVSMPGFLAARRFDDVRVEGSRLVADEGGTTKPFSATEPDGLMATARQAGLEPEVAGYYLAYCELLAPLVESCRSFSFYNAATLGRGFSPVHPILTTLTLWPRQFPLGLAKGRPFAWLQRGLVEESFGFAARPLGARTFRLVHFSIPHLPFAFDRDGFDPPLDPLKQRPDTAYVGQMQYADSLLGELLERLRGGRWYDRTTIVLFSDHGFRGGGRETDPRRVPFIVKRAGQVTRRDLQEPVQAERLLRSIAADGCTQTTQSLPRGRAPVTRSR